MTTPTGRVPCFHKHESRDWCHFCGARTDVLVDCWHAENAEHTRMDGGRRDPGKDVYMRICLACARRIVAVAGDRRGSVPEITEEKFTELCDRLRESAAILIGVVPGANNTDDLIVAVRGGVTEDEGRQLIDLVLRNLPTIRTV